MALESDELYELVAADVQEGVGAIFEATAGGLAALDTFGDLYEPIASSTHDVLPWMWEGRHVAPLAGIPPTGTVVQVRGVTIVDRAGEEARFHRFVDWLGVFQQLGASLVTRPAVEAFPGDLPRRDRFGVLDGEQPSAPDESS